MELAAAGPVPTTRRSWPLLDIVLVLLVVLLACGAVFGGVLVDREHDARARAAAVQDQYGAVLAAARAEAEALVNLRHDRARAGIDRVLSGATGRFRRQYASRSDGVMRALERAGSVMAGKVVSAGIVSADAERATVLVATTGTVENARTDGKPVARYFRLRLELANVDGRWLTSDLAFVPAP